MAYIGMLNANSILEKVWVQDALENGILVNQTHSKNNLHNLMLAFLFGRHQIPVNVLFHPSNLFASYMHSVYPVLWMLSVNLA